MPTSREQLVGFLKHLMATIPELRSYATRDVAEWPGAPVPEVVEDAQPSYDFEGNLWFNNLELHELEGDTTGLFDKYPLRLVPDTTAVSPAASLVTALALTNATGAPDALSASEQLYASVCARIGGCQGAQHEHPLLEAPFEPDLFSVATARDDGLFSAWVLSATAAPVVRLIANHALVCSSEALCGELCEVCKEVAAAFGSVESPVDVVRAVETALVGGGRASVDVAECVASEDCIAGVAERAAASLGSVALPMGSALLQTTVRANAELFDAARAALGPNESFANASRAMRSAAQTHAERLGGGDAPKWSREAVAQHGRRMAETNKRPTVGSAPRSLDFGANETRFHEWFAALSDEERTLFAATANTAHALLEEKELQEVVRAHMQALRVWATAGANVGSGSNASGVCADPHIANRTISCRAHFALVGRDLQRLKREAAQGPTRRKLSPGHKRVLQESIESHLDRVCCARFEDRVECGRKFCEHHVVRNTLRRAGHVLRRVSEDATHPSHNKVTPDVLTTIENYILPELHEDRACHAINKSSLSHGGPTRMECVGKSLLKHLTKKHGLDAETVEKYMGKMGVSAGTALQSVQRLTGMIKDVRGTRRRAGAKERARFESGKRAAELLQGAERRLSEADADDERLARERAVSPILRKTSAKFSRGFARGARTIAEHRHARRTLAEDIKTSFSALDDAAHHARLDRMAGGRAAGARFERKAPRFDSFHFDNLRQHLVDPILAFEALQADEGSVVSRFASGVSRLNELAKKWQSLNLDAHIEHLRRERRRERRLAEQSERARASRRLFDLLEERQSQRRLEERDDDRLPPLELPAKHALSWLHEVVDWKASADEWQRMAALLRARVDARQQGRSMAEILEKHPTGYRMLDDPELHAFSRVGDALRRFWHIRVFGNDSSHTKHVGSERDRAGRHHPERHGRVRRLAEGIFGPAVAVPFVFSKTLVYQGTSEVQEVTPKANQDNIITSTLRYLVYGVVGCYLTEPRARTVSTQRGEDSSQSTDGSVLKVLRSSDDEWLCFPSVPYALPSMSSWREVTNTQGVDYDALTYEEYCTGRGFQQITRDFFTDTLGVDINSETAKWLGIAGALRASEAIDSVENFVKTSQTESSRDAIGYVLCGIAEFGGVFYTAVVLLCLLIALPLVSAFNAGVSIAWDVVALLNSPLFGEIVNNGGGVGAGASALRNRDSLARAADRARRGDLEGVAKEAAKFAKTSEGAAAMRKAVDFARREAERRGIPFNDATALLKEGAKGLSGGLGGVLEKAKLEAQKRGLDVSNAQSFVNSARDKAAASNLNLDALARAAAAATLTRRSGRAASVAAAAAAAAATPENRRRVYDAARAAAAQSGGGRAAYAAAAEAAAAVADPERRQEVYDSIRAAGERAALGAPPPLARGGGKMNLASTNPFDAPAQQGLFSRFASAASSLIRSPPKYGEVTTSTDSDSEGESRV